MKRILFLLALVGCAKQQEFVTVTFDISVESGRFPTKGISDEITSAIPGTVDLLLVNTSSNVEYNAVTGTPVTLPIGTYQVTGGHTPTVIQNIAGTNSRYTSGTPKIVVDDEITIVANTSAYSVSATWGSFALGVLPSEVSTWTGRFKTNIVAVEHLNADGLWWIFVTGNLTPDNFFYTTITSIGGQQKSFSIYTSGTMDGLLAEYGKWYILHPDSPATQSGTFSLGLPEWSEGN